jgi:hypothetical protein
VKLERRFRDLDERIVEMRRELDKTKRDGQALRARLMRRFSFVECLLAKAGV